MKPPSALLRMYYENIKRERVEYLKFIGEDIELYDFKLWCKYKGREEADPFNDEKNLSGFKEIVWDIDEMTDKEIEMYGYICVGIKNFIDIEKIIERLGQYHYISEMMIIRREDLLRDNN